MIVYGATGGVGKAIARLLSARGVPLHLVGRKRGPLEELAGQLDAGWTVADVTDDDAHRRVASEAGPSLGGLVYAVGTLALGAIGRVSPADAQRDFHVNALGAALAVQAALPALRADDAPASIVLFSSVAAVKGFPNHASIAMAKGAVAGLTLALAAELAPKVRVNAIAPSLTRTPMAAGLLANPQMAAAIEKMHPLGRVGEPGDLAALAAFLLSPDAGWVTGQVIGVDGGRGALLGRS